MAKLTKTQEAINAALAAQDQNQLDEVEFRLAPALKQSKLIRQATRVVKARRCQLYGAQRYHIGAPACAYLQSALSDDQFRPAFSYVYVSKFDTDTLKGNYIVASDTYRMHTVRAAHIPEGCYHLYDGYAYALPQQIDAFRTPSFEAAVETVKINFVTKVRLLTTDPIANNVLRPYAEAPDFEIVNISIGAEDPKRATLSGPFLAERMSQLIQYQYLIDAMCGQDCTVLLGYPTETVPVCIVNRLGYVSFVVQVKEVKGKPRGFSELIDSDERDRRFDCLVDAIVGFYPHIERQCAEGSYVINGVQFQRRSAAYSYYLDDLVQLDNDLAWVGPYSEPGEHVRDHAGTRLRNAIEDGDFNNLEKLPSDVWTNN